MQLLSPLWDYVFKYIFRNTEVLSAFLKAVLKLPGTEFSRLSVSDPFLFRRWKKDKLGILDIKVHTSSGKIITVELQVEKQYGMRNRILYYTSRLIGEQLKAGDRYDRINQVITIVICDHILLPEEPGYMNRYEVRNERSGGLFTDLAGIVILEIPKLPAEEEEGTGSWLWLKFFRGGSEKELEMLGNRDTGLRKAVELLKELSGSNARRRWAEAKEKRRRDQWAREEYRYREGLEEGVEKGRTQGREEGRSEGIEEGLARGIEESARKMKAAGVAPEQISAWTGLSPEAVKRLQEPEGTSPLV